jgi:hypothetical protein
MSWDADFHVTVDNQDIILCNWNHTHNTNKMIEAATEDTKHYYKLNNKNWWDMIQSRNGAAYLHELLFALEQNPTKYRAMNPRNGWGNYDSLLPTFRKMAAKATLFPSGHWNING